MRNKHYRIGDHVPELGDDVYVVGYMSDYGRNQASQTTKNASPHKYRIGDHVPELGDDVYVVGYTSDDNDRSYEDTPQSPEITQSEAFLNSLKHGLSFGLDDEVEAITAAGRDSDDDWAIPSFIRGMIGYWGGDKKYEDKYDKVVNELRDYQRRMSDTHYWTSLGGNILGSALPSLATLGAGAGVGLARWAGGRFAPHATSKLGQLFSKAIPTPVGTVGKWVGAGGKYVGEKASPFLGITNKTTLPHLLKVGALSGALHGIGEGEGLGHTLQSAALGAGFGAGGAAVGSAVGSGLGSLGGLAARAVSPSHVKGVPKETLREITKHLSNDTAEALGKSFKNTASPNDYVVDHSPILQDLIFEISRKNPDASLDLIQRAGARAKGGGERIHQAADEYFVPRQNVTGLKDDLIASKKAATESLYGIAKKTPIGEKYYGALNELMERPYFKQAYDQGLDEFTSGGNKVNPFSSKKFSLLKEEPNMGVLHETQRKLRFMIDTARNTGDDSKVRTLVGIRKKLLEIMDDVSSEYTKGRALYRKYSSHVDAMREGEKVLSKAFDKDKFSKIFGGLAEGEQEYLKKGARAKLLKGMDQTKDKVSKAKQIFDTDDLYSRFANIYGSDKASAVKKVVDREANYADLYNRIPNRIADEKISFTHNITPPTSVADAAMQTGKATLKASYIPFKTTALRERQRIEKDVVKLLTGGTNFSNDEIVNILQRMVQAQHKGYVTKEWMKQVSAALFGGGGKAFAGQFNMLSAPR
ncbi:hypothetical protein NPX99_08410 [Bartonella sp. 220]|uniref:hypothetical protein n=1 Tax=Bartonella sp. 220B TaxID=2967260 RepID=UPI0022A94FC2|nr:hypothetical protein [Bartonella sp. 220B]MCZ2159255.1 hypothetical protein [Bartonella sp. 220B]